MPSYGKVDREYGMRMATMPPEDDGPIWMVNLMRYHERTADGRTGREADDEYTPTEVLDSIGARIVFAADVSSQPVGTPRWDRIGIVRYATRRSFVEMQSRPDFQAKHVHKEAGMAETIVLGCQPLGGGGSTTSMRVLPTAGSAEPGTLRLAVEGTIVGDGRSWGEVRFGGDPADVVDGGYGLELRPFIDRLASSLEQA